MARLPPFAVALLAACSSAPAPERSAHADDPRPGDGGTRREPVALASAEPDPVDDLPEARLEAVGRRFGCEGEGPAKAGAACALLRRFSAGRPPAWQAGTFPGAVLAPAEGRGTPVARPALLAVRGEGARIEVGWAALSPDDPRQAAELAAMAADALEGRAPRVAPAIGPGVPWARPAATRGASAAAGELFARAEGGATIVVVPDEQAPLVAVHRAAAR